MWTRAERIAIENLCKSDAGKLCELNGCSSKDGSSKMVHCEIERGEFAESTAADASKRLETFRTETTKREHSQDVRLMHCDSLAILLGR